VSMLRQSWTAVLLCSIASPLLAADAPPSEAQIATWIRALDDENYAAREAAGRNLATAGVSAIGPLAKAIASESPEVSWRANDVLEQIGISGDEKTLELVSQALEEVSKSSKNSLTKSRSEVRERWKLLRHERAVEQIVKLGGKVRSGYGEEGMLFFGGFGPPVFGGGMMPAIAVEEAAFELAPIDVEVKPAEEPKPDLPARKEAKPEDDVRPLDLDAAIKRTDDYSDLLKRIDRGLLERIEDGTSNTIEKKAERALEETKRLFAPPEEPKADAKPEGPKAEPRPLEIGPIKVEFFPKAKPPVVEVPLTPPEPPLSRKGFFEKVIRVIGDLAPVPGVAPSPPEFREPAPLIEDAPLAEPIEAVEFVPEIVEFGGDVGMVELVDFDIAGGVEGGVHAVSLGKEWKGGVEGLKLLKDVMHLNSVEMSDLEVTDAHVTHLAQVSELRQLNLQRCRFDRKAVEKLKKARPELAVLTFGDAVLGISGESQGEGFHVSFVAPNSGAHAAGIHVDDVITHIDGEVLQTFERLTHIIASHTTGDKVKVEVVRHGKKLTVEATLKPRGTETP
jgi:hypothetical protein